MPLYEFKSFTGISDYADKGIRGSFKMGRNLDVRKINDTLSCEQALMDIGTDQGSPSASQSPSASPSRSPSPSPSASPSPTPSPSASASPSASPSLSPSPTPSFSESPSPSPSAGLDTVFEDLVLWWVKATDGYLYGFGDAGNIYRIDSDFYVSRVYKDPGGKITGAAEWYDEDNKVFLYWVTGTNLHRKEIPGRADWNDVDEDDGTDTWPKINLNSADWHTMVQAGGSLHIANRNWLALVGYDSSFTNESLDLIPGNHAKTLVERNGRVIIGTARASDPNKSINAAIDSEVPLAQVGDEGGLFYANMVDSVPIRRFPGGGKCNPGGVCNKIDQVNFFEWEQTALSWIDKHSVGNLSLWGIQDADSGYNGVYSYGRTNKNYPFTLNLDFNVEADEIGAITSLDGTVYVSYRDGSDYGVKVTDPNNKATAEYESLEVKGKPDKTIADITEWKHAEIYCEPLPDGTSIEFKYKLDKTGDWKTAYMEVGNPDTSKFQARDETKAVFNIAEKGDIFEFKVILNPTGNTSPEVHRIRVYFN